MAYWVFSSLFPILTVYILFNEHKSSKKKDRGMNSYTSEAHMMKLVYELLVTFFFIFLQQFLLQHNLRLYKANSYMHMNYRIIIFGRQF